MRVGLISCVAIFASGCVAYTADDNDAFVQLFGNAMVNQANQTSARPAAPSSGDAAPNVLRPDTSIPTTTVACPDGGNMTTSGSYNVVIDPKSQNGYADLSLMMTITSCSANPNGTQWTINGANLIALNGHDTITGGYTSGWSFLFSGGYDVFSDGNLVQHCSIQASLTNQGWSGQWCGFALR